MHIGSGAGLIAPAALLCGLATPALAQEAQDGTDEVQEPIEVTTYNPQGSALAFSLLPAEGLSPTFRSEGRCAFSAIDRSSSASALGCAFEDSSLGIGTRKTLELGDTELGVKVSVGRGTSGAFALDHTMLGYRRGLNAEATLASVALDGKLLDRRIEFESRLSWSREWHTPVAQAPILPLRIDERTGSASNHRLKFNMLDQPGLKWSVEGRLMQASEDYRPYYVTLPDRLFAPQGGMASLDTRLQLSDWQLSAGMSSYDNSFVATDRLRAAVSYGGVTLRWSQRDAQSALDNPLLAGRSTATRDREFGIDLDAYTLVPLIAFEETGLASLVPKMLSFDLGERAVTRTTATGNGEIDGTWFSLFGMWTTTLGDTVVNYRADRERGFTAFGSPHEGRRSFLMLSHGVRVANWLFDVDYISTSDASGDALIFSEGMSLGSIGFGARYERKGRPSIDFRIGRDNLDVNSGDGALRLLDNSLRAELEIDFSAWLQKVTRRDDIQLRLDMQWDFDDSGYEFRLLDEVIDREFRARQGRGALVTYVKQLQ